MWIIAGLGNPGLTYRNSRHNAGFQALDRVAERLQVTGYKNTMSGLVAETRLDGERIVLVKPQTYMNLSGDCLQPVLHFYKVPADHLIVLYDDIVLPVGAMRIRANGSAGTHNGMRSIVACVNSTEFPRVRIGMGRDGSVDLKDFVLSKPSKEEQAVLSEVFDHAAEAALLIVKGQMAEAQARYNKKGNGLNSAPANQ